MRAVDIIIRKRDKQELTKEEIEYFIKGYAEGSITDYQAAAWAMAVLINGMNLRETTDLTVAIAETGELLDLSNVVSIAVDKHSTGGVGDKTTLVVQPVVAACGLPIGKMSGRGLGFSGGTLDKMESIPGYRCDLTTEEFMKQLEDIGMVLTGQTADLAPADGKLYALRDVTGTVDSIPLIASSIMSKKIAGGANAIVLDVKIGKGAFMSDFKDGKRLAETMVAIAKRAGKKAIALISDMNQPLGYAVGNALELKEAIETLHGFGPEDFRSHCIELAKQLLIIGNICRQEREAEKMVLQVLEDGSAWESFRQLVIAQGGEVSFVDEPNKLPSAKLIETIASPKSGYLKEINARMIGETAVFLGAGREKKGDQIDHAVGIVIHNKVGDYVEKGAPLFTMHVDHETQLYEASQNLLAAHQWSNMPVKKLPLFYDIVK
jgi:pyrimidine-nucleoside phosphorylase